MAKEFNFQTVKNKIGSATPGNERDMYAWIRDLLVAGMEVAKETITIDSSVQGLSGVPDITLFADTGVFDRTGKPVRVPRCVIEVKAEPLFMDKTSRHRVFEGKRKYIGPFIDWFVMIDTKCIIARPVSFATVADDTHDIVVLWDDLATLDDFIEQLKPLQVSSGTTLQSLRKFRSGDTSELSVIKLTEGDANQGKGRGFSYRDAGKLFNTTLADVTNLLQNAVINIVNAQEPQIAMVSTRYLELAQTYSDLALSTAPVRASCDPIKIADTETLNRDLLEFNTFLDSNRVAADLALWWLPNFYQHIGGNTDHKVAVLQVSEGKQRTMRTRFATETANLLLARILLIRFFEDHGIFGTKKYICNGGVAAFQSVFDYFDGEGYETLLKHAFDKAATIYPMAFESHAAWLFESHDQLLSRVLELSMLSLSRFDFATVSGDILNGIYDRFLDKAQRKQFGEYYTPSGIARYMLERANFARDGSVFDPACGTGTFLIEAYEFLVGQDMRKGRVQGDQVVAVLERLGGNDLNPFAAVLAQIQMLWHLLPYRELLPDARLVPVRITGQMNSLVTAGTLDNQGSLFTELNSGGHALVVANPPYVRPERNGGRLDEFSESKFGAINGAKKDLYTLFLYKALKSWCRADGIVAFIIPLSFCDNDSNAELRKRFQIGCEFRILELVDLEALAPHIFDASVNPLIIIADRHKATEDDTVIVRVANMDCFSEELGIDLTKASEGTFNYGDIWSPDGRILTKLTHRRHEVYARYFKGQDTFLDIARKFWVGRNQRRAIIRWSSTPSKRTPHQKTMLRRGGIFRRQQCQATSAEKAFDFYKGENISTCALEGEPAATQIDIDSPSDASLWKFRDILPEQAFAFAGITLGVTAVKFNPHEMAFLDTTTIFIPQDSLGQFPFDVMMFSNIYQWVFATANRLSPVTKWYSHLYPGNLAYFPWINTLTKYASEIESLRVPFLDACKGLGKDRSIALANALGTVTSGRVMRTLGDVCRDKDVTIEWPHSLSKATEHITIEAQGGPRNASANQSNTIALGRDLFSVIGFEADVESDAKDVARRASIGLLFHEGAQVTRDELLAMPVPEREEIESWIRAYEMSGPARASKALIDIQHRIDKCVAGAFGISAEDLEFIQDEMATDPYLMNIKPKLPYTGTTKRGLNASLQSADRYR